MGTLIRLKNEFIKFPEDARDFAQAIRKMEDIAGFPNAVGAIDGSHISIKAPHVNHDDYFNRKQNYFINLQGAVDADGKFIDVSTRWHGSIHDAQVLRLTHCTGELKMMLFLLNQLGISVVYLCDPY